MNEDAALEAIKTAMMDLGEYEVAERILKRIHDRVSGKSMHIPECASPLADDFQMTKDDIYRELGMALWGLMPRGSHATLSIATNEGEKVFRIGGRLS